MDYRIIYDPTVYVRDSIRAVVITLFEAIALVVVVVLLFLQTWRASIIPLIAGAGVAGRHVRRDAGVGFSLNTLSLGLVLAIGIVVDDAIVVVENVERHIEHGLSPRDATYKAMEEVSGPIIAIALVLVRGVHSHRVRERPDRAVLPPVRAHDCHLNGDLGLQFADAQPGAGVAAAAAARRRARRAVQRVADLVFGRFFGWFNRLFTSGASGYVFGVTRLLRVSAAVVLLYGACWR